MADGKFGIGGIFSGIGEAIAKPLMGEVKELGKEIAGQTGTTLATDPSVEEKKKAEEAKINQNQKQFYAQLAADQERLRQQRKQEEEQRKQAEEQEQQAKKQEKEQKMETRKQEMNVDLQNKQRLTERKTGTG